MDTFIEFCRRKGNGPITINIEIRNMKAAFNKAVKWDYIKENPFKGYSQIKYHKKLPKFLTIEQINKVFDVIGNNRKYRLMFTLFIYTGGRREEIQRLQWPDIKDGLVWFRRTKTYEPRAIPITDNLQKILSEYGRGVGRLFDITLDQITHRIKWYLRKAGINDLRLHDLRHTFASHLRKSGVSLDRIKELLGHTSLATTMIYAHLDKQDLKEAIRKLPY